MWARVLERLIVNLHIKVQKLYPVLPCTFISQLESSILTLTKSIPLLIIESDLIQITC
jgi:hypothetical protein